MLLVPFTNVAANYGNEATLTIIFVNDRHGRMDADAHIAYIVQNTTGNVLLLDAGDTVHGQTTAILTRGAAMVELMNAVGYSAMVAGNHEFNFGAKRLVELTEMMDFPLLSANVFTEDGNMLFQPYEIFHMDGITVGIFGITTPETVRKTDPRNVAGLTFECPTKVAVEMVYTLNTHGVDFIIALTHLGIDEESLPEHRSDTLAEIPGIHLIVDGHSHLRLEMGLFVGDTLIVQAYEHGKYIGVVEIIFSGGEISMVARLIEVTDELPICEEILGKIAALDDAIENITGEVIGQFPR